MNTHSLKRAAAVLPVAGLVAGALVAACPAQANVAPRPEVSQFGPLRPPLAPQSDPKSEVQELLRQISELDDQWDGLTPAQRNQRIAGLQQQVTVVQNDVNNLPPDQRPEVQAMLGVAIVRLADILRKERWPAG
jgi:hypothetical protein